MLSHGLTWQNCIRMKVHSFGRFDTTLPMWSDVVQIWTDRTLLFVHVVPLAHFCVDDLCLYRYLPLLIPLLFWFSKAILPVYHFQTSLYHNDCGSLRTVFRKTFSSTRIAPVTLSLYLAFFIFFETWVFVLIFAITYW